MPALAEIPAFLIDLLALFTIVFLIGLQKGWQFTVSPFFSLLAGFFDLQIPGIIPGIGGDRPFHSIAEFIRKADHYVDHGIGQGISALEREWHRMLLWTAYMLTAVGESMAFGFTAVFQALHLLHGKTEAAQVKAEQAFTAAHTVTTVIKIAAPKPAVTKQAVDQVAPLAAQVAALQAKVDRIHPSVIIEPVTVKVTKVGAHATSIALPHPVTLPGLGRVESDLGYLKRRVAEIGKQIGKSGIATVAGIAGLVAVGLHALGLGHLRESQCKTNTKAICGMNPSALEALVADALLIVGTVSLVEFAKGMQEIVSEVEGPIRAFWRAT